jgi:hypothetical protein
LTSCHCPIGCHQGKILCGQDSFFCNFQPTNDDGVITF